VLRIGGTIPDDGLRVILTDTLESPRAAPPHLAAAPLFERRLAEENIRARKVKLDTDVIVCLGNPPYFRQVIEPEEQDDVARQGGWVRYGDEPDRAKTAGILRDFVRETPGVHVKNLYNLYVYFWRWALWKVFETGDRCGIVSFISASSYLRGPGFAGMRRFMRESFDELWILDLGGEGRGARQDENVFAIQTPVAIAVGYRSHQADCATPAAVRYARIEGTQREKLDALDAVASLEDVDWLECFAGWNEPLLPRSAGDYFAWPAVTDLFPWQHSGLQFKRTWPISADPVTLEARWNAFTTASADDRPALFRETPGHRVGASFAESEPVPRISRFAYRSLDRQYMLADFRLADRPRPVLWKAQSARQLFMTSLWSGILGEGPAAVVTHLLPDLHHFRGSFGGKNVVPLWRDAACTQPNLAGGLMDVLESVLGGKVTPEDLFAYCYALLSAPSYTTRFAAELELPGARVPITSSLERFRDALELGAKLVWLHTFGERFVPPGRRAGKVPQGSARYQVPIPPTAAGYPTDHAYDPDTRELEVGDGLFAPVAPEVRAYSVSGLDVVGSWLDYRMKQGAGKKSSKLDEIRPQTWPAGFSDELLELLWVIEATVALGPKLDETLEAVVAGDLIAASALPAPTELERKPPN
jgi:hypothetical protein